MWNTFLKCHTLLHNPDREKLSHPQYNRDKCRGVTRSQYYHQPLVSGDQFPSENRTKQTYITASNTTLGQQFTSLGGSMALLHNAFFWFAIDNMKEPIISTSTNLAAVSLIVVRENCGIILKQWLVINQITARLTCHSHSEPHKIVLHPHRSEVVQVPGVLAGRQVVVVWVQMDHGTDLI